MAKTLTSNVHVDGRWYGPDYPGNKATDEVLAKITNPAAFQSEPTPVPEPDWESASVEDVKAWVGESPERAQQALDYEGERDKPRTTLVTHLEAVIDNG